MQMRLSGFNDTSETASFPQRPAKNLTDGDEVQAPRGEAVQCLGHRVNRAAVDVMAQDDSALAGV